MVWIHGGGNLAGAGSEDAFDGTQLALCGVTVVTFNYRLGAFGFLAHPDVGSNFAVLDHVAALSWVSRNIEAFGGASDNVTIFGQSAGALSVRTLLSVGRARGLFHRAIIQSAGFEEAAFAPPRSYERAQKAAEKLFDQLGSHDLHTLRQIPTQEVLNVSIELSGIYPPPGQVHTPANLVWNPVPDGDVVSKDDFSGWPSDVPVLLGCVENEARYFIKPSGTYTRDTLEHMARAMTGPRSSDVIKLLGRADITSYEALDQLFTTAIWFEPAFATLKRFEQLGRRIYCYRFARVSPDGHRTNELAKHTAEIRYVFGNLAPVDHYDTVDAKISRAMKGAWIEFARTGEPRHKG
jgi:para-nitrobenzyl esterase